MKPTEALEQFEKWMKEKRLMRRTRECYLGHASQFARFKTPGNPTPEEKVCDYLSWLAHNRSAVTQKQALNALVGLYRALGRPLGTLPAWTKPAEKKRVPSWVTRDEAIRVMPESARISDVSSHGSKCEGEPENGSSGAQCAEILS